MDVEVADKGLDLVNELNSCYIELQYMHRMLEEQEHKIRASVRVEYEDLVRELTTKLMNTNNYYEQNRTQMVQELLGELSTLRTEAMKKIQESGSGNNGMLGSYSAYQGKLRNLKIENAELRKKNLKLQAI